MSNVATKAGLDGAFLPDEAIACVHNANKALWEKGDFTQLAATMRQSGDELIESLGIRPGMDLLDLGCGDGTTAIPSALRGANVLGVDIATNLVAAGNAKAQMARLNNIRFEEGDASQLDGIADESFDLVVSVFGAMFAPRPFDTAKEMVRVTRTGGQIMMGNWIPGDPTLIARVLQICASYMPTPPVGFVSPVTWGKEEIVRERFKAAGITDDQIECEKATYTFRYNGSPIEFLGIFRDYYGPTMNAFEAAETAGHRDDLQTELEQLFTSENHATDGTTEIAASYLRVIVRK